MSATNVLAYDASFHPRTGEERGAIAHTSPAVVEEILHRAATSAATLAATAPTVRQVWLNAVSDALLEHEEELALLGDDETGLGLTRLRGEITGAARSIRFYASVAVEGSYINASSDYVNESITLARWNIPVGPVAVFGASNFPFAFGVIGHDVASGLAAGCPVIAKAHPAHPRLSVRLAAIARAAMLGAGAPEGTFDLVTGFDAGLQLVDAPAIRTVAFTGSQRGGMALLARAAARGVPVFAEMGTVNPVFVTAAAAADTVSIATGFVESFTLGAGQFCTKPGLIFAPAGTGMFDAVSAAITEVPPAPALTARIAADFATGVDELADAAGGRSRSSVPVADGYFLTPQVIAVTLADLVPGSRLLDECFGPVALVCEYVEPSEALDALARMQGSLAASVFTGGPADPETPAVVARLLSNVGRVVLNAWPTGVANTWSQQHGGPWPATSRPEATSVGAGALARFVRPVALQNADSQTLPVMLSPANPWRITRRVNGLPDVPVPSPSSKDIS